MRARTLLLCFIAGACRAAQADADPDLLFNCSLGERKVKKS